MKKLYYLASPFTSREQCKVLARNVERHRTDLAMRASAKLLFDGVHNFSPINYNGHWLDYFQVPGDWAFWESFDKNLVKRMDGIIVLKLDGWETSTGVNAEIEFANSLQLPVYFFTYEEIQSGEAARQILSIDGETTQK